jgi:UDP-N-acetylmuramoyl-tripeptide--D-alanyl-D-alanine ligase
VISLSLEQTAKLVGGEHFGVDAIFCSVTTDSRKVRPGDLFVALAGERFDGHDYLVQAKEAGAVGAIVERPGDDVLPVVLVPDTRVALGELAAAWRRKRRIPMIGVTGSNGKTTVKEMIAAILRRRGKVLATQGNLNNDIGLPLTLLREQDEDYSVVEMGANHTGEIRRLSLIAAPNVAVINNAGRAHLEGFGSVEAVASAKGEIALGLPEDGVLVINADDAYASLWRGLADGRSVRSFGSSSSADFRSRQGTVETRWDATGFRCLFPVRTPIGDLSISLALAGEHNRMNALAAIAATQALGVGAGDIEAGLASVAPVQGRLQPRVGIRGMHLVDDSYNANPESTGAAIGVLCSAPGPTALVLGDLAELGPESAALHAEIGTRARSAGIDRLFTTGQQSARAAEAFGGGGQHFPQQQQLIEHLRRVLPDDGYVLIKGSRSAAMERVVDALSPAREDRYAGLSG